MSTAVASPTQSATQLEANGVGVGAFIEFDANGTSFDAEAAQIAAAGVDAISLIPFAEGAAFVQALIEAGAGPADISLYRCRWVQGQRDRRRYRPEQPRRPRGRHAAPTHRWRRRW